MILICCLFTFLAGQFFALPHEILALHLSKKGLWIFLKVLCRWRGECLPCGGYAQGSRRASWLKSKCLKGKRQWVGSLGILQRSMFWAMKLQHRLASTCWTAEQLFLLHTATIPLATFSHLLSSFWNCRAKLKISCNSKRELEKWWWCMWY